MTDADVIKVLIVDDSAFARKVLREALIRDHRMVVVGTARDGLEALERIETLAPDVVTLDLLMPNLDGLGLLQALPATGGPRVVVVTTSVADSELAIAALEAGAVDLVHKPTALATDRLYELSEELREKIVLAASARRRPRGSAHPEKLSAPAAGNVELVVIGTSTGGPQALSQIVPMLPADLPVPILIALHIPAAYTEALARRLDQSSAVTVVEATLGELELRPGLVVLAKGGSHLATARRGTRAVAFIDRLVSGALYSPSVDHLFQVAAREFGANVLGVVLTGMGNDGLEGARAIRAAGGQVLAESAATSIIYGMPRAVSEAGLASEDVSLDHMPARILARL